MGYIAIIKMAKKEGGEQMKEGKIIAISNQKGGTAKTTSTFSLGVALAKKGQKVLLVDADPQGDLTTYMGWHNVDEIPITLAILMQDSITDKDVNPKEAILHHNEGVDLIPSNLELSSLEVSLVNAISREYTMKNVLNGLKKDYDYVLIDCMPSLGMITINALACADKVIIPVQSQFLATKGMGHLLQTVIKVRKKINPNLEVGGILLSLVDERTKLARNIRQELNDTYGMVFKIFDTQIPRAIKIAESTAQGQSIFSYDKNSKVALAYENFAKEVLKDGNKEQQDKIYKLFEEALLGSYGSNSARANEGKDYMMPYFVDENEQMTPENTGKIGGTNVPEDLLPEFIRRLVEVDGATVKIGDSQIKGNFDYNQFDENLSSIERHKTK